ncbi:MAG: hypothetical protein JO218_17135 [Burkholderiales bacterium]|nr:hypothetical protein [Burkholderiales bacterium]
MWTLGGYLPDDFSLPVTAMYGVLFAWPLCSAASWLAPTSHHIICWTYRIMAGAWVLHLLAAVTLAIGGSRLKMRLFGILAGDDS